MNRSASMNGILLVAAIIGFVVDAISAKMEALKAGRSRVCETEVRTTVVVVVPGVSVKNRLAQLLGVEAPRLLEVRVP